MTKAQDIITIRAAVAMMQIDLAERMRERDERMTGKRTIRLKKSRRRMTNKSKRGNR